MTTIAPTVLTNIERSCGGREPTHRSDFVAVTVASSMRPCRASR
jgi:hypothetical protein